MGRHELNILLKPKDELEHRIFEVYHGGTFVEQPEFDYVGSDVAYFGNIDPDRCSMERVRQIIMDLGYEPMSKVQYAYPGLSLRLALKPLETEEQLQEAFSVYEACEAIQLYLVALELTSVEELVNQSTRKKTERKLKIFDATMYADLKEAYGDDIDLEVEMAEVLSVSSDDLNEDVEENAEKLKNDKVDVQQEVGNDADESDHTGDKEENDADVSDYIDKAAVYPEWLRYKKEVIDDDDDIDLGDINLEPQFIAEQVTENGVVQQEMDNMCETDCGKDWTKPPALSDSDDEKRCMPIFFDESKGLVNVKLSVEMQLKNGNVFRKALTAYAVQHGFEFMYTRNDGHMIGVVCKRDGCGFYVYCSRMQRCANFQIKTLLPNHTCERAMVNQHVTSTFLAEMFLTHIRDTPNLDIESFQNKVQRELIVEVSKSRLYRAIKRAQSIIQGDVTMQYARL